MHPSAAALQLQLFNGGEGTRRAMPRIGKSVTQTIIITLEKVLLGQKFLNQCKKKEVEGGNSLTLKVWHVVFDQCMTLIHSYLISVVIKTKLLSLVAYIFEMYRLIAFQRGEASHELKSLQTAEIAILSF